MALDVETGEVRLLLDIEEAGRALRLSRTALYGLFDSGELRPIRVGRAVRIPLAELRRFVAAKEAERAQQHE